MASQEIKEMLVDRFGGEAKDWKRVFKKKIKETEVRLFENLKLGESYYVFGDPENEEIYPGGDYAYCIGQFDGELVAGFNPIAYWDKHQCLYDQHLTSFIDTMYDIPDWLELDEACENQFIVTLPEGKTVEDVKAAYEAAGLKFSKDLQDFIDSIGEEVED